MLIFLNSNEIKLLTGCPYMSKCIFQKQAFSYIVTLIKIKKLLLNITILRFHQFWWYSYRKFWSLHLVQVSSVFGSETVPPSYLSWLWIVWCIQALKSDFSVIFSQLATNHLFTLQPTAICLFSTCYLKSAVLSQLPTIVDSPG